MNQILSPEIVEAVMQECLADDEDGAKIVEGCVHKFALSEPMLEVKRPIIEGMLAELPTEFHEDSGGGGWSFLNACNDKAGRQWTGEHRIMEMLFALGEGIGKVKPLLPRELWAAFPGGMPYYVVSL